jgi:hypothetical protein
MIHESLLKYRNARFLWWALGLMAVSIALYLSQGGLRVPSGDTWQGYVLGTIGALLVVWLTLLGVRKRRYSSSLGTLQGWTSAHVYLGAALLLVATLHSAAQLGWNVHTFAYVLMCLVILSGFVGIYAYMNIPQWIAENHAGGSRQELFAELFALNSQLQSLAQQSEAAIQVAVTSSIERTAIGGDAAAQLFGGDRSRFVRSGTAGNPGEAVLSGNADQQQIIDYVAAWLPRADKAAQVPNLHELVVLLCRRQAVLRRIRRDIRLRAWLQLWLYVHVPLSVALLVALVAHILTTFMYW